MNTSKNAIRTMTEVALFAAIGFVLDELQGAIAVSFPNGGSIGFAMVAVLLIAYRRGFLPALLTGLVIGLFDIATKAYLLSPLQVMFDYILPYALVGFAGLFKPLFDKAETKSKRVLWLILGAVIGGLLKFVSHFVAGVVWWGDPEYFAWGLNNWNIYLYSLVYNFAFIGPSIVLCGGLLVALFSRAPRLFTITNKVVEETQDKKDLLPVIFTSFIFIIGLFFFIFFLIKYVQSFKWKESSSKYSFDQDSMVNMFTGLALLLASINSSLMIKKGKFHYLNLLVFILSIALLHVAYSTAHIISMYIESEINNDYWIWFVVSLILSGVTIPLTIKSKKKQENTQE